MVYFLVSGLTMNNKELSKERVILKDELRYRCVIKVELFAILGIFVG